MKKYLIRLFIVSLILSTTFLACKKSDSSIKSTINAKEAKQIAELKFFLKETLNVSDNEIAYNLDKKEFKVYDQTFSLSDLETRYNESNEFKLKYKLN